MEDHDVDYNHEVVQCPYLDRLNERIKVLEEYDTAHPPEKMFLDNETQICETCKQFWCICPIQFVVGGGKLESEVDFLKKIRDNK